MDYHAPITPNFPSSSMCEIVGDNVANRCWPTTFHTITAEDADGWCQNLDSVIIPLVWLIYIVWLEWVGCLRITHWIEKQNVVFAPNHNHLRDFVSNLERSTRQYKISRVGRYKLRGLQNFVYFYSSNWNYCDFFLSPVGLNMLSMSTIYHDQSF